MVDSLRASANTHCRHPLSRGTCRVPYGEIGGRLVPVNAVATAPSDPVDCLEASRTFDSANVQGIRARTAPDLITPVPARPEYFTCPVVTSTATTGFHETPIGFLLRKLDRLINERFERTLGARGITRRQWQLLHTPGRAFCLP